MNTYFSLPTAVFDAILSSLVLTIAMAYLAFLGRSYASNKALWWWTIGFAIWVLRFIAIYIYILTNSQFMEFVSEAVHILSALALFVGTSYYVKRPISKPLIITLSIGSVVWTAFGIYGYSNFYLLTIPLYFVSGIILIFTGVVIYRRHRKAGGISTTWVALAFILWGLHKFDYPFLRKVEWFAPIGFSIGQILTMLLTVSLIMLALIYKTNKSNKQAMRLRYYTDYDILTGLPTRRTLTNVLAKTIIESSASLLVIFLDLRNFHEINESLGSKAGDYVLRTVARRLYDFNHGQDIVARIGGDEFAIIIRANPYEDSTNIIRRIAVDIAAPIQYSSHQLKIEATIGTAWFPRDGHTAHQVIQSASTALSSARQEKVRFRDFGELESKEILERMNLRRDLLLGLNKNEFSLVYQPQIDVKTNHVVGVEALLRWTHSSRGSISPATFIPLAESSEFIVILGEWVLQQALTDIILLTEKSQSLRVAINLSAVQFKQSDLASTIADKLKSTKISPKQLELEITESLVLHDEEFVNDVMTQIGEDGVQFAIDDFGTGYSSLSILRRLPLDRLKIDRSFIQDIEKDSALRNIVEAIIWMGQSLNLRILAEGVETEGQLELLRRLGCDEVQGYFTGKPMPFADLITWLDTRAEHQANRKH
ncbi:MAG: EAL domain-containing protein [Leptonema sp. (in: Bacteria)]|nr:EAL domain-containing protein [Leptonema sp. (in: bacteria)]